MALLKVCKKRSGWQDNHAADPGEAVSGGRRGSLAGQYREVAGLRQLLDAASAEDSGAGFSDRGGMILGAECLTQPLDVHREKDPFEGISEGKRITEVSESLDASDFAKPVTLSRVARTTKVWPTVDSPEELDHYKFKDLNQDASLYLYRKMAKSFPERQQQLERMIFKPVSPRSALLPPALTQPCLVDQFKSVN